MKIVESETQTSVFDTYLLIFGEIRQEEKSGIFSWAKSFLKALVGFFRNRHDYTDYASHPSIQARRDELDRGKNWGFRDYIRYAIEIRVKAIKGLGRRIS